MRAISDASLRQIAKAPIDRCECFCGGGIVERLTGQVDGVSNQPVELVVDVVGWIPPSAGFQPAGTACWTFSIPSATVTSVTLRATGNTTGRTQCSILLGSEQINVTLDNTGAAARATSGL